MSHRSRVSDLEGTVREYHRVLTLVTYGLMFSVVTVALVSAALVHTGTYPPFLNFSPLVWTGIVAFMLLLLAVSYPLQRKARRASRPTTREEALGLEQTGVMVGMAVRDAVGVTGGVIILLTGHYLVGGGMAALALAAMFLDRPREQDLITAVRGLPSQEEPRD